ncbi:enoyl-CoA hydratase [Antricoccus suffuscus]|uniref:Enoyl-CoA hydratase n=1 Tax=Antricoccus suffuscus TaxID=1629062 RepID=A0A2T0ZWI1_9ACTN|nr:enoyl-CoA hydratase family protein [Antricoccus suffuscus]PRZ40715.1 enoyl-CoA hydratase [Antricoccus suffuscus]
MSENPDEVVHTATDKGICTITLDAPHNRNALSRQLVGEFAAALDAAIADDAVRAIVLTHTGGTFCAGADLSEASSDSKKAAPVNLPDILRRIIEAPKPVIARLDGHVRAGGTGIVGACDIVISSDKGTFAFSESLLGLAPAVISLTTIPRMTSRATNRYFLTGEVFDAKTAERIGLITTAADDLDAELDALTAQLRKASPQGLRESKKLQSAQMLAGFDENADKLTELSMNLFATEEAHEGMRSFLERRPARWATD